MSVDPTEEARTASAGPRAETSSKGQSQEPAETLPMRGRTVPLKVREEVETQWKASALANPEPGETIKAQARVTQASSRLRVKPRTLGAPENAEADYQLLGMLGKGGMGAVYSARQTSVDRLIAIKVMKAGGAQRPEARDAFFSEAAVTGELEHPNIVPVYDLGVSQKGELFYAMKQVKGVPWGEVLGKKALPENLEILMRVCDAVAFAHSKGIIHRDLKPANVMLGEFGEVLVMDWGLSAALADGGKVCSVTTTAAYGGTPAYMAPEMALGDPEQIGTASDVYLLGGLLYEIVTGLRPHAGKGVLQLLRGVAVNEIQPTDKSGELVDIARRALATEPKDRYESVKGFQDAVRACQAHFQSIAVSDTARERLEQAHQTRKYEDFAQASFGYQQALELWPENHAARQGAAASRVAHARCAFEKDDLDLAASLIEPERGTEKEFAERIEAARQARQGRARRLKALTYGVEALVGVILIGLTVSYVLVRAGRDEAERERNHAVAAQKAEAAQRLEAEAARNRAEAARNREEAARKAETEQRALAERATAKALREEANAKDALAKLGQAVQAVFEAKTGQEEAEAKRKLAEVLASKAQDELAQTGMLLEAMRNWSFSAAEARRRQEDAAAESGHPVQRTVPLADGEKLELALIPGGEFVMGSPPKETNRAAEEYPHRVALRKPFYMGRYEVTRGQWKAVMGEDPPGDRRQQPRSPREPATNVSWTEIQKKFLPSLQKLAPAGFRFRLPTEAEWEQACRAGANTAWHSGDRTEDLEQAGWCRANSGGAARPVGSRAPNAWGLYDMHGNVAELCEDLYDSTFYLAKETEYPLNASEGVFRVVRGGSWANLPQHCRAAYRSFAHPDNRYDYLGLRVVLARLEGAVKP